MMVNFLTDTKCEELSLFFLQPLEAYKEWEFGSQNLKDLVFSCDQYQ